LQYNETFVILYLQIRIANLYFQLSFFPFTSEGTFHEKRATPPKWLSFSWLIFRILIYAQYILNYVNEREE